MPYTKNTFDRISFFREGHGWNGVDTTSSITATLNGSRTGDRVTNWKAKIRSGGDATSNMTSDRLGSVDRTPGSSSLRYYALSNPTVKRYDTWEGYVSPLTNVFHLTNPFLSVDNKALSKIYKKIREEQSLINGQAFLGELRQTIMMLKKPYASIAQLVNRHVDTLGKRKRGLSGPSKYKKQAWKDIIASTWLETQFGLKPLMSDVEAIAQTIAHLQVNPTRRVRLQAREFSVNRQVSTEDPTIVPNSFMVYLGTTVIESRYDCQWTVGLAVTDTANMAAVERARQGFGFTLENFVPALWEVLPWSWLVDYFSNVGEIIEAGTTCTSGVTFSCKTTRESTVGTAIRTVNEQLTAARCAASSHRLDSLSGGSLGTNSILRRTVVRTKQPLGMPTLELSLPGSRGQWANMMAVAVSRRSSVENLRL